MVEDQKRLLSDLARNAHSDVEFVQLYLRHKETSHGRGARSRFSGRAGFSSRSFLTEFLAGKKRLSRESLRSMKSALALPREAKNLFELLAMQEQPKLRPNARLTQTEIKKRIAQTRTHVVQTAKVEKKNGIAQPHLSKPHVFQIYAALGTVESGASLDEIQARTRLGRIQIRRGLDQLLASKAVVQREDRFYASVQVADSLTGNSPEDLGQMVRAVCQTIDRRREAIVRDPSSLSIYSAFSVDGNRILELRKKLADAIFEVVDEFQDDSGNSVEQVFISLFREPLADLGDTESP